jgi:hypothetical protein
VKDASKAGRLSMGLRSAFRFDKAATLVRAAKDAGRVTEKIGVRGALDTLRVAETPKELTRAARLAEAKGTRMRAILKLVGRGALILTASLFDLSLWLFGLAVALLGVLASIKATTERITQALIDRSKARRARRWHGPPMLATPVSAG